MRGNRKKVTTLLHFALCTFLIILVSACGDAIYSTSETGSIAFSVEWKGAPQESSGRYAAALDCATAGVSTVEGKVYDSYYNDYLAGGGPWDCQAHSGTITGVRASTESRTVVILGKDSSGSVLYRGETGVTVTAGQTNDAGTIVAEPFTPTLLTPEDSQTVGSVSFTWQPASGASAYQIQVSTDSGFASTLIDETVTTPSYTPPTSLSADTYYWRVRTEDSYANKSAWSEVWSFIVSSSAPTATITSPSDGSTYTEGDTITFTGTGEDAEDGTLTGASLVWTSSIDGEIGTGESFTRNDLSVGTHTITLIATDSEGATGSELVTVTVNPTGIIFSDSFEYSDSPENHGWDLSGSVGPVSTLTNKSFDGQRSLFLGSQGTAVHSMNEVSASSVSRISLYYYDDMLEGYNWDVYATIRFDDRTQYLSIWWYNPSNYLLDPGQEQTDVPRSLGWHQFEWVIENDKVSAFIDGIEVASERLTVNTVSDIVLAIGSESPLYGYFDKVEVFGSTP